MIIRNMNCKTPSTQNKVQEPVTLETIKKMAAVLNERSLELKPGDEFYVYCKVRNEVIKVTI